MLRKENYKDLNKWRESRNRQKRRYYRKTQNAENSKSVWTSADEDLVMAHSMPDTELSKVIGRSVGAIQMRRYIIKSRMTKSR